MLKEETALGAIAALRAVYGAAIEVVDFWPTDRSAVGVVRPGTITPLVYFSTVAAEPDSFFVALELPPEEGSEVPYQDAGSRANLSLGELVAVVGEHLQLRRSPV